MIIKHVFSFQFSKWKQKLKTKNEMMVKLDYNNLLIKLNFKIERVKLTREFKKLVGANKRQWG